MIKFLLWCILLVLCWPLALVALVLYPLVWLLLLPFRWLESQWAACWICLKQFSYCRRGSSVRFESLRLCSHWLL